MNYAIYLRKSRADMEAEKQGELETLTRHEHTLIEYAKRNQLRVTAIYKEIVSGESISSRPQVQELLSLVEQGMFAGVLVMEIERLARGDTIDQGTIAQIFKQSDTKIITPLKIFDPSNEYDEEYFEFGLFMARREYKTINRRIQRGRLASVQEGKYINSTPPFGYDKVKVQNGKGYTLVQNSDSDIVRYIYDLYTKKNIGMALIAAELNKITPPARADKWSRSSVSDILSNPVYMGKIRWGYKKEKKVIVNGKIKKSRIRSKNYLLIEGMHEAIIKEEVFYLAEEIRNKRGHPSVKDTLCLKNPFSGLIYCKKCGTLMTRLAPNKRNHYDTLKCPNTKCDNISAPIFLIEEQILEIINIWFGTYQIKIEEQQDISGSELNYALTVKEQALERLKKQLLTTERQLEQTFDLLEQCIYTKEEFLERNSRLSDRANDIRRQVEEITLELDTLANKKPLKHGRIPVIESFLASYHFLRNPIEKNRLLKILLNRVEYEKNERNTRGNLNNDNFKLVIYPTMDCQE